MQNKQVVSIALSDEEIDILAKVQSITLLNPKETIMHGIMSLHFIYVSIEKARERARKRERAHQ
jgi:hypothetical protein